LSREQKGFVLNKLEEVQTQFRSWRYLGSGALSAAQVSASVFGAYVNFGAEPWDKMASSLIVNEAGGVTYGSLKEKGVYVAAANQDVLNRIKTIFELQ